MDYVPSYDESDDKRDDEQLDTTDMSDLESEESAEQSRNQRGHGLKIHNKFLVGSQFLQLN